MKSIFFLLCLFFTSPIFANTLSPEVQNFIEEFEVKKTKLQGGAIAILHKDKVIYKKTFGYQKGKTDAITSSTLFPLASVSKPVSAVAVALMVDQGKLDFEKKYKIPYLKNSVSLTHILSHTTGYPFPGNTQIEQGMSRQKLLAKLQAQTPNCKPGQCYFYSNTTYSLIEEVLNAEGQNLQLAIKSLRQALKTNGIQIVPLQPNMSIAYPHTVDTTKKTGSLKALPFPPYYPKATPAAAGVFASLDGMIEFYKLSFGYRPDLISQKTLDLLFDPMMSNRDIEKWSIDWPYDLNQIQSSYGRGWRILEIPQYHDKELLFHAGMIAGAQSFIGHIPHEEIGIIILVNQRSIVPLESGIAFWGNFLQK